MKKNINKKRLGMLLVTIGIVYGDIGTSPMYVMKSIVEGNGGISQINPEFIIGSLSLVIWTITLLTTIKYVLIALKADNHGEGGIFSLYALVKSYGKWMIIPAMLGGAALLADGLLTPAVTVTTAVEGLRSIEVMNRFLGDGQVKVVIITLIIISTLLMLQHMGTSRIGSAFGPIMLIWFTFLGLYGVFGFISMPSILKAFNPLYAIKVLVSPYNKKGIMILGSVFLATTGAEALYSDMGHVGRNNIYLSWPYIKICLIFNYLGQGAWIIQNSANASLYSMPDMNPFYMMLPEYIRPFAVVLGAAAAVIASQALITGSYTLVSEAIKLDLLPHMKINYPSDTKGQLYIGTVNTILWIGCCLVVLYFRSGSRIESAYGLAITLTMLMTTLLLSIYLWKIRKKRVLSVCVLLVFGVLESVFFVSSLGKFMAGGYITAFITLALLLIEIIWYRGTKLENIYKKKLIIRDYIDRIDKLHKDESYSRVANNLVYLDVDENQEYLSQDVLYSILDKQKRADAYWLVNLNIVNEPDVLSYEIETYDTDFLLRVKINLGFKCPVKINEYIRLIVQDLQKKGELPFQENKYSIYGESGIGNFKFCTIHKVVTENSGLNPLDEFVMIIKYGIRKAVGSKINWYGLGTSEIILEKVPLVVEYKNSNRVIEQVKK